MVSLLCIAAVSMASSLRSATLLRTENIPTSVVWPRFVPPHKRPQLHPQVKGLKAGASWQKGFLSIHGLSLKRRNGSLSASFIAQL